MIAGSRDLYFRFGITLLTISAWEAGHVKDRKREYEEEGFHRLQK
jgi:hypothetical protein